MDELMIEGVGKRKKWGAGDKEKEGKWELMVES